MKSTSSCSVMAARSACARCSAAAAAEVLRTKANNIEGIVAEAMRFPRCPWESVSTPWRLQYPMQKAERRPASARRLRLQPIHAAVARDDVKLARGVHTERCDLAQTAERPFAVIDRAAAGDADAAPPAATKIAVEIMAAQAGDRVAAIDMAAGHGAAAVRVIVLAHRLHEA